MKNSGQFYRQLKPRCPAGGMIIFPAGLDPKLYRAALISVLSCRHTEEWTFGQGYKGKLCVHGIKFNEHSLTAEITGVYRSNLEEIATVLARKCAVVKVLVLDFSSEEFFIVNRSPVNEENYNNSFVNSFYRALEAEKVIRGNEFKRFLEKKKYHFPGEMFYHIRQAKKQFLWYFFLTIDKYPHNTNL